MSEPFLGEIRLVAFNFPPRGWAICQGQLLPINQNQALFSLLGTQFGGNGQVSFALPDYRGRVGVGQGQGPGLSMYTIGQGGGQDVINLAEANLPEHRHGFATATGLATTNDPRQGPYATPNTNARLQTMYGSPPDAAGAALLPTGGSQAHDNTQPFLGLNYIIALQGIFPPR